MDQLALPVRGVHQPGGEPVFGVARVRDPDVGENILDGGGAGEVLVEEQLLWNNPLLVSLVWPRSKVSTRRRSDAIGCFILYIFVYLATPLKSLKNLPLLRMAAILYQQILLLPLLIPFLCTSLEIQLFWKFEHYSPKV